MCAQRLSASTIPALVSLGREARGPLPVLNAFRHQRFLHHLRKDRQHCGVARCSTPFGINDSCTRWIREKEVGPVQVLNAFRHQRFLHWWSGLMDTPGSCAQRLSASTIPALTAAEVTDTRKLCSTPFGINDSCTWDGGPCPGRHRVLNAFRHQRFLHMGWRPLPRASPCAQRLSASTIPAPAVIREGGCLVIVLNAFRHQRFLHRRNAGSGNAGGSSAQRLSASTIPALAPRRQAEPG